MVTDVALYIVTDTDCATDAVKVSYSYGYKSTSVSPPRDFSTPLSHGTASRPPNAVAAGGCRGSPLGRCRRGLRAPVPGLVSPLSALPAREERGVRSARGGDACVSADAGAGASVQARPALAAPSGAIPARPRRPPGGSRSAALPSAGRGAPGGPAPARGTLPAAGGSWFERCSQRGRRCCTARAGAGWGAEYPRLGLGAGPGRSFLVQLRNEFRQGDSMLPGQRQHFCTVLWG